MKRGSCFCPFSINLKLRIMKNMAKSILFSLFCLISISSMSQQMNIYSDFSGGNLLVDKIKGDTIWVRPDLRDIEGDWFYWYFAVSNAQGRKLTFVFNKPNQFTKMGASISTDGAKTWQWQGGDAVDKNRFTYQFASNSEVRFSMGIPYTQENFDQFMQQFKGNRWIKQSALCQTKKGRTAELVKIKNPFKVPNMKVLVTARNHACEMMGDYLMEGIILEVMNNTWLKENVEFVFLPFMDKDGVEDGDQGKNRLPRDHNRDYSEISIHETTAALRKMEPLWSENKLKIALDLHCPWIKNADNELIFLTGSDNKEMERKQRAFSDILEQNKKSELSYFTSGMAYSGKFEWNDPKKSLPKGDSFQKWSAKIPGVDMTTTIEFPYAYNSGQVVSAQNAVAFGKDVANAIELYLKQLEK
jgi:hypothetical protein